MLKKLNEKRSKAIERIKAIAKLAETEDREYSAEERTEYDSLVSGIEAIDGDIKREEKRIALEKEPVRTVFPENARIEPVKEGEFRNIGEFVHSIVFNRTDNRLRPFWTEFDARTQSMGVGSAGGFNVPEKFRAELLQVDPQSAVIRPRARVYPAGDPPDAKVTMPSADQTAASNVYKGAVVYKLAEGGTIQETDIKFKEISLEPQAIGAFTRLTNKLIRNWAGASAAVSDCLRGAMIGFEETQFILGNGVGGPIGFTKSAARIDYSRATASAIAFADVSGMYARLKFGGSPVWLASQTTLPQLVTLRDSGNNQLWYADAQGPIAGRLYGIPLIFADRLPALGTAGDLCLCDLSYYLIQDGSGPIIATSDAVYWGTDYTAIKIIWNVDGKPWLTAPLPIEGSTSNTVSPFVVLN